MLPLFFAPSWNFSGRLLPGLGFVPPAMPFLAASVQQAAGRGGNVHMVRLFRRC
jgi:hypothetical protein